VVVPSAIVTELLILLVLVLFNGVFSGAEIAVLSVRKTRLQALVESGSTSALAVMRLRDAPERFLATVQVGITVLGATAAAFSGSNLADALAPKLVPWVGAYAHPLAFGTMVGLVSFLSLVLGELVPKSLALRTAESYSRLVAKPLLWLSSLARPLVWMLTESSNLVLRFFGDRTTFTEARLSPDELRSLVEEASKVGSVDPRVGDIAARAIDFGDLTAADVMVPRREVVAVPRTANSELIQRLLLEEGHSRMPVYEGSIDTVVGYISARDILALVWDHKLVVLDDILRPPYFVHETMPAIDLMRELQSRRAHLAMVADEQGVLSGIVTLEDLVEELVGDIFSEHEKLGPQAIHLEKDGAAVIKAEASVRDINRALSLHLPEGEDYTTIAGLVISLTGRIPGRGTRVVLEDGTELEIVDASARRVKAVKVQLRPSTIA
jgi:putative hemolysin